MSISITQGNVQENITSAIIMKLYLLATDNNNSMTLSGNLYSPTGYAYLIDYLNQTFGPNFTLTVPDTGKYIYFEDSGTENILKANNVSSDGVGITVNDANNATLTSVMFKNNTTITKFNEFKYFSKANTNPPTGLFEGCTNLLEIDLSNATALSGSQFKGCTNLIINSNNLLNLKAVWGSSLNGVSFVDGIFRAPLNTLAMGGFEGVKNLSTVDLSQGMLSSIDGGSRVMYGVDDVTVWKFPKDYFVKMDPYIYCSGGKLLFVYGLESLTDFGDQFFSRQANIQNPIGLLLYTGNYSPVSTGGLWKERCFAHSLFLPKVLVTTSATSTGRYNYPMPCFLCRESWDDARMTLKLLYFKNISTFGLGTFYKTTITNLVINNTTVPTYDTTNLSAFSGKSFETNLSTLFGDSSIGTVWVPDSAVQAYQNSPLFSGMTIKSIDLKSNGVDYDLPRFATYADWETAYNESVENGTESPVGLIEEYM